MHCSSHCHYVDQLRELYEKVVAKTSSASTESLALLASMQLVFAGNQFSEKLGMVISLAMELQSKPGPSPSM
jgi:hypothetical protein